jgi:ELMO domain-containing protein
MLGGWHRLFHKLYKYVVHLFTGTSEIERILTTSASSSQHSLLMTMEFFSSVTQSDQLSLLKNQLLCHDLIEIQPSFQLIKEKKQILSSKTLILSNLKLSLQCIRQAQLVTRELMRLKDLKFDWSNQQHYELLDQFWHSMLPNKTRTAAHQCSDWGEVGFQGHDPATDFRGMGLLGLHQLTYFSSTLPSPAHACLRSSHHPRRFFPFAATGINITAFVLELCTEHRLLKRILESFERNQLDSISVQDDYEGAEETGGERRRDSESVPLLSSSFSSTNTHPPPLSLSSSTNTHPLISHGIHTVHDVYCEVYLEFHRVWEERDPQDVMQFQRIFAEVKHAFRMKYQSAKASY